MFKKVFVVFVILVRINFINSDQISTQIYSFEDHAEDNSFLSTVSLLNSSTKGRQTIATMPTGRNQLCGAAIPEYPQVYSFGGRGSNNTFLDSVSRLDSFTGEWQTIATMPTGRNQFCGATIGTKFYLFGGLKGNHTKSVGSKTSDVYDCSTNIFTRLRSMPQRREGCGAAVLNGSVYVAGGWDGTNSLSSVIRYDVHTDQWSTISSMNTSRVGLQLIQLGGYLFAIGGKELNTVEKYDPATEQWSFVTNTEAKHQYSGATSHAGRIYVSSQYGFEVYDPSVDLWTSMDSPTNHSYFGRSLVSMNDLLWAIGGVFKDGNQTKVSQSVFSYNNLTSRWTKRFDIAERMFHVSLAFNPDFKPKRLKYSKLYVFGGMNDYGNPFLPQQLASASRYDSITGEWQSIRNLSTSRESDCGAVVGNKIYLFGGSERKDRDFLYLKDVQVYDCSTDTYKTLRSMPEEREGCGAAVLDGYIYVAGGSEYSGSQWRARYSNSLIRYNIQLDQWSLLSPMKQARRGLKLVELGGLLYAIWGELHSEKTAKVEVYNSTTDQWSTFASTSSRLVSSSAIEHQGKIYVFSYIAWSKNRFEVYSPSTNRWTKLNSSVDENLGYCAGNTLISMNGKIWSIGGRFNEKKFEDFVSSKRVYTYDLSKDQWTRQQDMDTEREGANVFAVVE